MVTRHLGRLPLALAVVLAIAAAWALFAPPLLGGSASYVVTGGKSMEPRFHAGDLAVVRARPAYIVGEIVAYRSEALDALVLHRLIWRDGERYLLKGDANDFVDPEQPTYDELVGSLAWSVPHGGDVIDKLRSPVVAAAAAVLAAAILLGGAEAARRRRGRRRARVESRPRPAPRSPGQPELIALTVTIALAAVAVLGFAVETSATKPDEVTFAHGAVIEYRGAATRGVAYPDGRVQTGEPLFLGLVGPLDVSFTYRFSSGARHELRGRAALAVELVAATGWKRTVQIAPWRAFSGDRVAVSGLLDVGRIPALLDRLEAETGLVSTTYQLQIVPRVVIEGTVEGTPLQDTFAPVASFPLDRLVARLPATVPAGTDPLRPEAAGALTVERTVPRTAALLGQEVSLVRIRAAAAVGSVIAGLVLLGLVWRRFRRRPVAVSEPPRGAVVEGVRIDERLVELTDLDALIALARRYDRVVVHERREHGDAYWFADDGLVYLCLVECAHPCAAPSSRVVPLMRRRVG